MQDWVSVSMLAVPQSNTMEYINTEMGVRLFFPQRWQSHDPLYSDWLDPDILYVDVLLLLLLLC